jgi:CRP-like cAMP-binding protein
MIPVMQDFFTTLFKDARDIHIAAKACLFHTGDPCQDMFLVVDGRIDLIRHSAGGARLRLHVAGAGQVVAEASAYSDRYHCDGEARVASHCRVLSKTRFLSRLDSAPALGRAWAAMLADGLQRARLQSEIRTMRTVSERLDIWLQNGGFIPPKGALQDLAETLGVSREAMYREMACRRR